jgi:hypothetical protein
VSIINESKPLQKNINEFLIEMNAFTKDIVSNKKTKSHYDRCFARIIHIVVQREVTSTF